MKSKRSDRLSSRYGHPALYRPLMTPMVHARAQSILASIYRGRLTDSNNPDNGDFASVSGYSDTYALDPMKAGQAGKSDKLSANLVPGFEMVDENRLDFQYFKDRAEFGDEHGGGDIYHMTPNPYDRPGTADTWKYTQHSATSSRAGSPAPPLPSSVPGSHRTRMGNYSETSQQGTTYPTGYTQPGGYDGDIGMHGGYQGHNLQTMESREALVPNAQGVPVSNESVAPGSLGGGPGGYGNLPQEDVRREGSRGRERERDDEMRRRMNDPMDYDYYRSSSRRQNAGWQGWTG